MGLTLVAECWIKFHWYFSKVICLYNYYNVLSPFLKVGTMIDSFHSSGSSSLFQIELISSWISEKIVLLPASISSAGMWWNLDESLNCFLYFTNRNFVGNPALLQLSYKNKIGESRVTELQQISLNTQVLPDDSKYCLNWSQHHSLSQNTVLHMWCG